MMDTLYSVCLEWERERYRRKTSQATLFAKDLDEGCWIGSQDEEGKGKFQRSTKIPVKGFPLQVFLPGPEVLHLKIFVPQRHTGQLGGPGGDPF
jgi:hypothetical protein